MNRASETEFARPVTLAPSLLAADWTRIGEQVTELGQTGAEWLHFDAMDGQFVPNLSFGPMFMAALRPLSTLHFDAHLMLHNPGDFIEPFLEAGADSISIHVEGNAHLHRLIWRIKDAGKMAGAVLNPASPVHLLDDLLADLDFVLVMSVNPGFGGQKFLPLALCKIEALRRRREERGLSFLIEVDGGVGVLTAPGVVRAGADILVCGSGLFVPGQPLGQSVAAMRRAVDLAKVG